MLMKVKVFSSMKKKAMITIIIIGDSLHILYTMHFFILFKNMYVQMGATNFITDFMKKRYSILIICCLFLLLSCEGTRFMIGTTPEPPITLRPLAPGIGYIWIEGEWFWNGATYQWRNGYWSHPVNHYRWVPGSWRSRHSEYYWNPGRWKR